MITLGNFVGQVFPDGDPSDLDFFPWPAMNEEFGTETVEAPIDGWMLAANPKNPEAAKELLYHFGTAEPRRRRIFSQDPTFLAASLEYDTSGYTALQQKAADRSLRGGKRDPVPGPRHQPGVRRQRCRSGVRRLHLRPLQHRRDPRGHAGPGRGNLRGVTFSPAAPAAARRRALFPLAAKRGQQWQRQSRSRTRPHQ